MRIFVSGLFLMMTCIHSCLAEEDYEPEWMAVKELPSEMIISHSNYQPISSSLVKITPEHPEYLSVRGKINAIKVRVNGRTDAIGKFNLPYHPYRIEGEAIKELFPRFRFYLFTFTDTPFDDMEKLEIGRLASVPYALVDKAGIFFEFCSPLRRTNYKDHFSSEYCYFLESIKFKINDESQLRKVVDAYCEIFRVGDTGGAIERVGPCQWEFCVPLRTCSFKIDGSDHYIISKDGRILTRVYGCEDYRIQINPDRTIHRIELIKKSDPKSLHNNAPLEQPDIKSYRYQILEKHDCPY